jgi:hypothetical protein
MRFIRSLHAVFVAAALVAGACSGSSAEDPAGPSGGKADEAAGESVEGCGECGPGYGCLKFWHQKTAFSKAYTSYRCEPYGSQCTQQCGTPRANGPYLFCEGEEYTCHAMDQGDCSSYVYTLDNPKHCGGYCNSNCASCEGTQCACTVGGQIVNLAVDVDNCGACGHRCAPGEACRIGSCAGELLCPVPLPPHYGGGFGSAYVNPLTDGDNCGACGVSCGGGRCDNGECVL